MHMQKPSWISSTFDAGNLITLAVLLIGAVTAWNRMDSNQQSLQAWQTQRDKEYSERRAFTDSRFSAIESKIQPLDAILYRLGKQESETSSTNARIDRVVDTFSDTLKELRNDVNAVGTKVEVLQQTINDMRAKQQGQPLGQRQ